MRDFKESEPTDKELVSAETPTREQDPMRWKIDEERVYSRRWNFLFCSIYTLDYKAQYKRRWEYGEEPRQRTYLGILKNVLLVGKPPTEVDPPPTPRTLTMPPPSPPLPPPTGKPWERYGGQKAVTWTPPEGAVPDTSEESSVTSRPSRKNPFLETPPNKSRPNPILEAAKKAKEKEELVPPGLDEAQP